MNVRRETCIHEAGHILVALRLGMEIKSVEIRFAGGALTRTLDRRRPQRESVLRYITVALGGPAASKQIESLEGCRTDYRNVARALASIEDPRERAAIEAEARRMAERIVDQRWGELSAIALRLEVCRRLSGDDLRELLAPRHRAAA